MKQSILIKSNKFGLTVILSPDVPFEKLLELVGKKFYESRNFFKDAQMAVAFEGRELSEKEQIALVQTIQTNSSIFIPCIVDIDKTREELMKQAIEQVSKPKEQDEQSIEEDISHGDGKFYKGTLRSGQVLESETSIIILGDVNPGARVVSKGNVVILGTLKGNIVAGAAGNEDAFVAALAMDPMQIRIGDVIARNSDKPERKKKNKSEEPMIAYVDGENIYIEPISKEAIEDLRI